MGKSLLRLTTVVGLVFGSGAATRALPAGDLTLRLSDYAVAPITGALDGATNNAGSLARINFMRQEPGGRRRMFVNDLNGPLYILGADKKAVKYLDFNGRGVNTGMFDRLPTENGLASGLISFEFDPDYARNGRFYTIHVEDVTLQGSLAPDNTSVPGLDVKDYRPTPAIATPGEFDHEAVVIEWTDRNVSNTTFEGTARELMRVQLNSRIHPMGDLAFNPTARQGDADWRVLYIACGDGGSGEQTSAMRLNPQRLDTMVGKILRMIPDLSEHTSTSTVSDNGRYRIPRDNPFADVRGARKEIWAYGLRNPHRLTWDVDPANRSDSHLIATVIGLRTWETVVIVRKGANYGYSQREGTEALLADNTMAAIPQPDTIPVQVSDSETRGTTVPRYPVIEYKHGPDALGDAIAGGVVYRGAAIPELRGKFIFGDTTTGHVWYADVTDMIAADDDDPRTLAQMHEVHIAWDDPGDQPNRGVQTYPTMFPIVEAAYHTRGGKSPHLPGRAASAPNGRVDLRFAIDRQGEIYFLTKSDGTIRAVTGVVPGGSPPSSAR
jgi:Glucose / Sorbosone dehydrogenase